MAKLIDLEGLKTFLAQLKNWATAQINSAKSALQANIDKKADKTTTVNGHALSGNVTVSKSDVGLGNVTNDAQVKRSEMGAPSGVATLGTDGKVPTAQLPSYVDDVLDVYGGASITDTVQNSTCTTANALVYYNTSSKKLVAQVTSGSSRTYYAKWKGLTSFPDSTMYGTETATGVTPAAGKIYVYAGTNKTYRWSGSDLVEISASLALGTTSSTAFRGDYGNTAYQHATKKGAAFASGLYKITTNDQGHVTAAAKVTKSDITALGIPGQDTNTTYGVATQSSNGLMSSTDKKNLDNLAGKSHVNEIWFYNGALEEGELLADAGGLTHKLNFDDYTKGKISFAAGWGLGLTYLSTQSNTAGENILGIEIGLNYATAKTRGAVRLYSDAVQNVAANAVSSTSGRTYAVQLNSNKQMVVNVPWTDTNTTYGNATTSQAGLMSAADKKKLDGYSVATTAEVEALFN